MSDIMRLLRIWMLISSSLFTCNYFLNAEECKEGERINLKSGKRCEPCPEKSFHKGPNNSQQCQPCTICRENSGSKVIKECSKTSNALCQCATGFVPRDTVSAICRCPEGSGLVSSDCLPCQSGFFTATMDSTCVKWKECRSGVKIRGNNTSDVICNDDPESNGTKPTPIHPTPPTVSTQTVSTLTTPHPNISSVAHLSAITTKAPKSTVKYEKVTLIVVVQLLTVLLTAVTCKLIGNYCIKDYKNPTFQTAQESLCRKPVEESGDSSLSFLVKSPICDEP
ncbi:hypothetical protein DPEC_G00205210 [Dallia pectoralis]|uniref:Uncharacterized protein n=1 Tax=Dallia pectoralis TaxID=75939 RepID=A0ACC2G483_DALPE|nr:hypothetical protein DPEC_G00205210 [Dallia pectoralis]